MKRDGFQKDHRKHMFGKGRIRVELVRRMAEKGKRKQTGKG